MHRILEAEIKKLYASKIWWLIAVGAVLPALMTTLSFLEQRDVSWLIFFHVALLIFNVQSLLVFSAFVAFLCAREYEDNTIEVLLCYPYPRQSFLWAKLVILFAVIGMTAVLFGLFALAAGLVLLKAPLASASLWPFIKVLLLSSGMHFLLAPAACYLAELVRMAISGVIYGIAGMCLCMMLYSTDFIQFIPPCIPFNLADHILGMDVMKILPYHGVHWGILGVWFVLFAWAGAKIRPGIYSRS